MQKNLFEKAKEFLQNHTIEVDNYEEFKKILEEKGGFIKTHWCSSQECEDKIKMETGATIRLIPFEEETISSKCIYCSNEASTTAFFAKAY